MGALVTFACTLWMFWPKKPSSPIVVRLDSTLKSEMLDLCEDLSARAVTMASEANIALNDGDTLLARQILDHARGQNAASQQMLNVIKRHVA